MPKLHRCRQFGRLALTDRSVGHGRNGRSVRFHLRDNTVDMGGRFGYTYGELRSISTVGALHLATLGWRVETRGCFSISEGRGGASVSSFLCVIGLYHVCQLICSYTDVLNCILPTLICMYVEGEHTQSYLSYMCIHRYI